MNDLEATIQSTIASVLKIPSQTLNRASTNAEPWDSLTHLNVVLALEEACDIRFPVERIPELTGLDAVRREVKRLAGLPAERNESRVPYHG